jgi:hypothetical protein
MLAQADFVTVDGTSTIVTSPADLELIAGERVILKPAAGVGLPYATRHQVNKMVTINSGYADAALTGLSLYFVDEKGQVQATFRFP